MNPESILGTSFPCACGKEHQVTTDAIIYGEDAVLQVPVQCRKHFKDKNVCLVADRNTFLAAGRDVQSALEQDTFHCRLILLESEGDAADLVCDQVTKKRLSEKIPPVSGLIAVGSGVINDLVKWVAADSNIPYIIFATAASMNGYASANVAASIAGVKTLIMAKAPRAVLTSPQILMDAPEKLTSSGLGDALAKPVSSSDWRLNHLIFDEYFCQFSIDLISELEALYLYQPEKIRNKDPEGIEALFKALCYSGVAMSIVGTSSPASGGEHLLSHSLDMLAVRDKKEHDLHGRQVGIGTILSAVLYEKVLALKNPEFKPLSPTIDETHWGSLFPEVQNHYEKKLPKADQALTWLKIPGHWEKLVATIQPHLKPAELIKNCLKTAEAAHKAEQIGSSLEEIKIIWKNANQMRARFTILDLAYMTDILPRDIDKIINTWIGDN
jgi:glycerol-1-phosphate dehydrogenase [NAD(P)+]